MPVNNLQRLLSALLGFCVAWGAFCAIGLVLLLKPSIWMPPFMIASLVIGFFAFIFAENIKNWLLSDGREHD